MQAVNKDCIFCKIVLGEIPDYRYWENENAIALLDIKPKMPGQTIVIPKSHVSYAFDMSESDFLEIMKAARTVALGLQATLQKNRVCLIIEGFEVPHVHVKLFPVDTAEEYLAPAQDGVPEELKEMQERLQKALKK